MAGMTEAKKKHRYKHVEGKRWIEVRVKSARQLFDARDPAPFRDRDLDDDFADYIVSSAREFPSGSPLKLVIYIEDPEGADLNKEAVCQAVRSYFGYKIDIQKSELKTFLKQAQLFLMIGLLVLAACLGVAQSLHVPVPPGPIGILREGIVIFGWVSIWKPIELLLFDWYPLYDKLRFYRKLVTNEIDVRFSVSN
jgi:hypothetical protein